MNELVFPKDFLWGSALSSHQAEGYCINNDWWAFEQVEGRIKNNDKSGIACDHYNKFEEDFELLRGLGLNAHRLSIEWSRIVPREGEVDHDELEHYHKVFDSLKKNNLTFFVTAHHFTVPYWFARKGGFYKEKNLKYFVEYCEILAKNFPEVEYWNTINEPNVYVAFSFLPNRFPNGHRNPFAFIPLLRIILKAHAKAYHILKHYNPKAQVGIVKSMAYFEQKFKAKGWTKKVSSLFDAIYNQTTLNLLKTGKIPFTPLRKEWLRDTTDFFGLNYYNLALVKLKLGLPVDLKLAKPEDRLTQMNWGVHPEGLYHNIMRVHNELKGIPIYITENGIATLDDEWRKEFILQHLYAIHQAIRNGANVKGYFYWASMDNFEWAEGFEPRFGLLEVDYEDENLKRIVRDSGRLLGSIARSNSVSSDLLRKYNIKTPPKD
ncbi:MAG: glycoside hydrolase family 1 protein [Candidatus Heimdallarchaeaceae archaeon]